MHGAISGHDHPNAAGGLARAPNPPGDLIIGNRIYAAWGVGDDGVMTIIDRKKLLPAAYGGTWNGKQWGWPREAISDFVFPSRTDPGAGARNF